MSNKRMILTINLFMVVTLTACSSSSGIPNTPAVSKSISSEKTVNETPVTMFSKNKEVEITLSSDWKVSTELTNPSLLKLATVDRTKSIRIDRVNRADYLPDTSLTDYMAIHKKNIESTQGPKRKKDEIIRTSNLTIDKKEAYVKEGRTSYERNQFGYITAYLESNHHFYIITYTSMYEFTLADREFFEKMSQQFRILNDEPSDLVLSSTDLTSHQGKYSQFQIRTPSNWEVQDFELRGSDLDISLQANNDYMSIYLEPKEESDSDLTLEEYGRYVAETYADPENSILVPERTSVEINGLKGIQMEGYQVVNKRKIVQLHTILEAQDHFVEIVFYTGEGRYNRVKNEYQRYTSTYKENKR
ncbi:hypothetical protein MHB84_08765 [Paenibacillus sp. FSL F4-0087]|uniref:hypothetical protein n=1 Tax=Paenibacillus sp. FSL F4-0087 TaxID=2921368 RepID=UPI00096DF806|nr:hypothetical protein BK122_26680 [Paenibacillus pabuli]